MSRELPEFPSLDYLRKQAKVRLRQLQQQNAGAKLTEAQFEIAREYGFPSWTKLKLHVESLPQPATALAAGDRGGSGGSGAGVTAANAPGAGDSDAGLFVRFTLRARRLIFFARYFAGKRGSNSIERPHLLLGLLEEDATPIKGLLRNTGAAESLRPRIEAGIALQEELPETRSIPLSADCRAVLMRGVEEADRLGHASIDTGHFWLAFLREEREPSIAVLIEILKQNGVSLDEARNTLIATLNQGPL
jgi:hypothetical protein